MKYVDMNYVFGKILNIEFSFSASYGNITCEKLRGQEPRKFVFPKSNLKMPKQGMGHKSTPVSSSS